MCREPSTSCRRSWDCQVLLATNCSQAPCGQQPTRAAHRLPLKPFCAKFVDAVDRSCLPRLVAASLREERDSDAAIRQTSGGYLSTCGLVFSRACRNHSTIFARKSTCVMTDTARHMSGTSIGGRAATAARNGVLARSFLQFDQQPSPPRARLPGHLHKVSGAVRGRQHKAPPVLQRHALTLKLAPKAHTCFADFDQPASRRRCRRLRRLQWRGPHTRTSCGIHHDNFQAPDRQLLDRATHELSAVAQSAGPPQSRVGDHMMRRTGRRTCKARAELRAAAAARRMRRETPQAFHRRGCRRERIGRFSCRRTHQCELTNADERRARRTCAAYGRTTRAAAPRLERSSHHRGAHM